MENISLKLIIAIIADNQSLNQTETSPQLAIILCSIYHAILFALQIAFVWISKQQFQ